MYLNKAIVIGNLTRDPEIKTLPSGTSVTTIGVATNRVWKDRDGNRQEDTQFHNVVVFGRQAETTAQYLHKGSSVLVEGRMQTKSWDAADGTKKYRTEVVGSCNFRVARAVGKHSLCSKGRRERLLERKEETLPA